MIPNTIDIAFSWVGWPLWAQVPLFLFGLWGVWKLLTVPMWGPRI